MKKSLKIIGIGFATLILLIVIAIFTLTILINPNNYKDQIRQIVKQKTGANLVIAGDINWSFFPRVGFKIHDTTLTKLPNFKANDFVKAGIIDMQIQILPLFHKQLKIHSAAIKQGQMQYGDTGLHNLTLKSNNIDINEPFKIYISFDLKNTGRIVINSTIKIDLNKQTLTADPIKLQLEDLKANGNLYATNITKKPIIAGKINIAKFNPKQLLRKFDINIKTQDDKALTSASANLTFKSSPQVIKIPNLQLTLDQSTLKGSINSINLTQKNINFDLNLDKFNTNRYVTKTNKSNSTATTAPPSSQNPQSSIPNPALKWSAQGKLRINQLNTGSLYATNVNLNLNANKGLINLNPITADFYKGSLKGKTKINMRGTISQISTVTNLNNVQLQPLLGDLINTQKLAGTANCNLVLSTRGNTAPTMIKNLNGNARINIKDGTIYGVDIDYILQTGQSLLIKKTPPPKPENPATKFDSLSGTFYIRNGQASNNDLLFTAKRSRVKGAGTINLPKQTLNYKVRAARVKTIIRNGRQTQRIDPIFVPIIITGPFDNLKYVPDFSHVLQAVTQELGQTVIKTIQTGGDVGEAVTKSLGKTLKKGFGVDKLFK
jgi:AsmA protein